jgi:hypothetical protein
MNSHRATPMSDEQLEHDDVASTPLEYSLLLKDGTEVRILASNGAHRLVLATARESESWHQVELDANEARKTAEGLARASEVLGSIPSKPEAL